MLDGFTSGILSQIRERLTQLITSIPVVATTLTRVTVVHPRNFAPDVYDVSEFDCDFSLQFNPPE